MSAGTGSAPVRYLLERAWVDGVVRDDVLVEIEDGRFTRVEVARESGGLSGDETPGNPRSPRPAGEIEILPGLTLPGLANAHSHAFHRALRGRTQAAGCEGPGSFWTWRDQMYAVAGRLDPDSLLALATGVYREMAAAGIATVGEFHYLHHDPEGRPYADPNEMGLALVEAARRAGVRLALLDTCYLSAGLGADRTVRPVEGVQRRFSDGDAETWAARVDALAARTARDDRTVVGAAIHSVRAVPADQIPTIVAAAQGRPLHVHLSEQRRENDDCRAAYALTPTQLLHDQGALGPMTTAVHATHLTEDDRDRLGGTSTAVCLCPTTERDLGDGIGPARALHDAGARLTLGSDSHAVVDLFEEMRAVELDERLATERRGHWSAAALLDAATAHATLGFPDAGAIAVGQRADLVTVDTRSVRTAGTGADEHTAVFAATAADVTRTVVDGRTVFRRGDEAAIGRELDTAIAAIAALARGKEVG
ncbi:formimidoylglutamate deiminase [Nocardioides sp. DS6]|uniref:Formimidoylglutamate deiminase n=1 Tax=Nocardioides eburneus TaxID=3231482 RepID=A0ABV3SZ20_9ACTN